MREIKRERKQRKKRKETFIMDTEGLPKRCKHPLEEQRVKPQVLFGIDRGGIKGQAE